MGDDFETEDATEELGPHTGAGKQSTALSTEVVILQATPVKVSIGKHYPFVTSGVIEEVRVEKIYQDMERNTFVIISRKNSQGARVTNAMSVSEFKTRVLVGGVAEIEV